MNTSILNPVKPIRTINFAKILPLLDPAAKPTLVSPSRAHSVRLVHRNAAPTVALAKAPVRKPRRTALAPLETQTLSVPKVTGVISRLAGGNWDADGTMELTLPFGMPRFVNARTLKRMLKAQLADVLLKRNGSRWEICEDSTQIDLADETVEFRLGAVQIFS
jgi:hypothetical protein